METGCAIPADVEHGVGVAGMLIPAFDFHLGWQVPSNLDVLLSVLKRFAVSAPLNPPPGMIMGGKRPKLLAHLQRLLLPQSAQIRLVRNSIQVMYFTLRS